MKLPVVSKDRWCNIYYKEFFPVAVNGGTCFRCDYFLSESENSSLHGVINSVTALSLLIFIER